MGPIDAVKKHVLRRQHEEPGGREEGQCVGLSLSQVAGISLTGCDGSCRHSTLPPAGKQGPPDPHFQGPGGPEFPGNGGNA